MRKVGEEQQLFVADAIRHFDVGGVGKGDAEIFGLAAGIAAGPVTEPFFTTKDVGKDTGLGLSMVAGFVQQSDGHLEIESEPGSGTSVRIFMRASALPGHAAAGGRATDGPLAGSARRVLLVDNDRLVRALMAEQLREMGSRSSRSAAARRPSPISAAMAPSICC
jgi:hypothetical protein